MPNAAGQNDTRIEGTASTAATRRPGLHRSLLNLLLPFTLNWLVVLYAVLALAIGWSYASLRIQSDYRQTLDMERSRLRGVAAAMQAGAQAMINDGLGAAIGGANAVMSRTGDIGDASSAQRSAMLGEMLTGGEYVQSLFLYTPGRFARTSRDGQREIANTPPHWLTLPRSTLNGATWVGKPIVVPGTDGNEVIPIARHLMTANRDGVWAGALFDFAAFDDLYRRVGRDLRLMGLIAHDGTVLIMVPSTAVPALAPGKSVAGNSLFRAASRNPDGGVVEGFGEATGQDMIYGYERVHGYDMTIFAGQSLTAVLAPWRDRRRTTLMVTAAASMVVGLLTWVLGQHLATRRRMREIEEAHIRRVERQTDVLLKFASRVGAGGWSDLQLAMQEICEQACDVLETDRVAAWKLMSSGKLRCVEYFERSGRHHEQGFEIEQSDVRHFLDTIRTERVICTENVSNDPRMQELSAVMVVAEAVSLIAAPVRCSGKLAGIVLFEQITSKRTWYADEMGFASGVADQIAQAYIDAERTQALGDLRRTAVELMRLQDEERRRIGRDLHDSTGQTLAALEIALARLAKTAPGAPGRTELLQQCVQLANQCSAEIRTASYLLHPPLLDELGLASALRWLADGFRERSGIEVRLDLAPSLARLSREEELTLFRVAQEALTNVHRHAQSPWVALRLFEHDGSVVLEIEDAGVGLALDEDTHVREGPAGLGVGLTGMRERIRQVGGTFSVEASRSGTLIRAELPREHDAYPVHQALRA